MSKWLWFGLSLAFGLTLLSACSTSAPPSFREKTGTTTEAFLSSTAVTWSGGESATCKVCGGPYACMGGAGWGDKAFQDPSPAGSVVTSVTVSVSEVGCGASTVTVALNGVTLGTYQPTANCSCNTCDTPVHVVTYTNGGGVPGYVYQGVNTLHLQAAAGGSCVARADISVGGADAQLTPSPSSIAFGNVSVGATSAAQVITVTNTGGSSLIVNAATPSAQYAISAGPGLPTTLGPNQQTQFSIVFSPTTTGPVSGSVVFQSNDAGGARTVTLSGTGVAPAIAASPNPLAFGTVTLGTTPTSVLTISNPGQAPLTVSALTVQGANGGDFALVSPPNLPAIVGPGSTLPLTVRFTPGDHGARSAQLVIASDAYQTPTLSVSLTGTGSGPRLVATPSSIDFGSANVGSPAAPKSVSIQNTGETTLTVSAIVFSGANAADFRTSTSFPLAVPPGTTAQAVLTFTPSAVGSRMGRATIQSNDALTPTAQVDLTGIGTSPVIAVAPHTLDFGDVRTATTSPAKTATITNTGNGPLTIGAATLGGADAAKFALAALALPLTLPANGTALLSVTFAPTTVAGHVATLTVVSNDPLNPSVVVQLKGNGVSPNFGLAPTTLDFGAQLVGRASSVHTADVTNTGSATLKVTALTIGGTNASAFAQFSTPPLPATVAPGSKLTLALTFTPGAVGPADGTMTIASDDPNNAAAVLKLTGLGVSTLLGVSPTQLDFGTLRAGAKSPAQTVTITNLGGDAITLVDGALSGASAADYKVATVAGKLLAGKSITASVIFAPSAGGPSNANVTFAATDPKVPAGLVALKGNAVSSVLTLDLTDLDFGHVLVGTQSAPKSVKVTNPTSGALEIAAVASDSDQFAVDSQAVAVLAPGASASFSVSYRPTTEGDSSAKIQVSLKGAATPEVAVFAKGSGDPAAGPSGGSGGCGCEVGARAATPVSSIVALALAIMCAAFGARRGRRRSRSHAADSPR